MAIIVPMHRNKPNITYLLAPHLHLEDLVEEPRSLTGRLGTNHRALNHGATDDGLYLCL